jgi:hypothetical protein
VADVLELSGGALSSTRPHSTGTWHSHCFAPSTLAASLALTPGTAAAESKGGAAYLLYWRKPEEWGQVIHDWVSAELPSVRGSRPLARRLCRVSRACITPPLPPAR